MSSYLVQLPVEADIIKFKQIKYLCSCVVTISKFRPNKTHGTQCFRCQEFGHASINCNKPPRCVKCISPHATAVCTKSDRTEPAHCCNCNEAHPANYRKCSVRMAYLESIEKKKALERKPVPSMLPPISMSSAIPSDLMFRSTPTWPSVVTSNAAPLKNQIPIDQLPADLNDKTSKEMFEILLVLRKIKSQFAACTPWLDKVMLVLSHLGKYA